MAEESYDPKIIELLKKQGNEKCVDCGEEPIKFVSINNSVFICINCIKFHLVLGSDLSYVKNIDDHFDENDIKFLSLGGNSRFLSNLEEYELINKENPYSKDENEIQTKYVFYASEYYRELIKAEVYIGEKPEKPDKELAQSLIEFSVQKQEEGGNDKEEEAKTKKNKKDIFGKIGSLFSSAASKTKSAIKKTGEKIEKLEIKDKLQQAGKKTISLAKETGKFVKDKANKAAHSNFVESGIGKIKGLFGKKEKTTSTTSDIVEGSNNIHN